MKSEYRYSVLALLLLLPVMGCNGDSEPKDDTGATDSKRSAFYEGYVADIQSLRKTRTFADGRTQVSSSDAFQAAATIFSKIKFEGMAKDEVLSLLGNSVTISDLGVKAKPGPDEPLVYRFDSGLGGRQYTLQFVDGKVVALKIEGLF